MAKLYIVTITRKSEKKIAVKNVQVYTYVLQEKKEISIAISC